MPGSGAFTGLLQPDPIRPVSSAPETGKFPLLRYRTTGQKEFERVALTTFICSYVYVFVVQALLSSWHLRVTTVRIVSPSVLSVTAISVFEAVRLSPLSVGAYGNDSTPLVECCFANEFAGFRTSDRKLSGIVPLTQLNSR